MTVIRVSVATPVVRVTQPDGTQVHVASSVGAIQGPPGPRLVEVVYQVSGLVPVNRTIIGYLASADITFIPADAVAVAGTPNTIDTTTTILDLLGNALGTVLFAAGATTGVVTVGATTLHKNEGLKFFHDANVDNLSDIIITIPANRGS